MRFADPPPLLLTDTTLGIVIVAVLIPLLYFTARGVARVLEAWATFRLRAYAPLIGGTVGGGGWLNGRYQGHSVRVAFYPQERQSGSTSTSFVRTINAFRVEVQQLPGQQDWNLRFADASGLFAAASLGLYVQSPDPELGQRLEAAGVREALSGVIKAAEPYETVVYNARAQTLTVTNDLAPERLPAPAHYQQMLDLAVRLAEINRQVNAVGPVPAQS
jgi:hypothetical protein